MHARQERHHDIVVVVQVAGFQVGGLSCQRRLLKYNRNKKGLAMIHTHKWMATSNKNNKEYTLLGGIIAPTMYFHSIAGLHHHQHVRTCHVCSACSPRCICRTVSTVAPPSGRWRPVKMALTCEGASRVVVIFFNIFTRRLYTVKTVQSVKMCTCCNYM